MVIASYEWLFVTCGFYYNKEPSKKQSANIGSYFYPILAIFISIH